jgi:hypothetical protein
MKPYMWIALVLALAGCADTAPPARLGLKLPPAALGTQLSLQQQLQVERSGRVDQLETALEIDDQHLSMVGLALGQRVMTLEYDGDTLKTWRHPMLPSQVRGEDVLEDVQLTYWPLASIQAALPPGWRIEDNNQRRILWSEDTQVLVIDYGATPRWAGTVTLNNLRYQYRLTIQSVPNNP